MKNEMPISEARHELTSLPERLSKGHGVMEITKRGKPVLAIMDWGHYESIIETLEIMNDDEAMAELRLDAKNIKLKKGKTQSWESVKKELKI